MKKLFIPVLITVLCAFFLFSSCGAEAKLLPAQGTECSLQAYLGNGHSSASLSCVDGSIGNLHVGLYPSLEILPISFILGILTIIGLCFFMGLRPAFFAGAFVASVLTLSAFGFGQLLDDSEWDAWVQTTEVKIPKEKALEIKAYIEEKKSGKLSYWCIGNNCVDFVQSLFKIAGHESHFVTLFPETTKGFAGFYGYIQSRSI